MIINNLCWVLWRVYYRYSILTPNTVEVVATTFDGYPMSQQGKSKSFGLVISSSAFGGIFAVILMFSL
ncbi:tripartite tricarboxylate transporter permease, partial [Staphylococcus xylosus]|nr:tripartite tricarboxylate transporter permease [Staphylococcus xylosus]